jgi:hypothetical protein
MTDDHAEKTPEGEVSFKDGVCYGLQMCNPRQFCTVGCDLPSQAGYERL